MSLCCKFPIHFHGSFASVGNAGSDSLGLYERGPEEDIWVSLPAENSLRHAVVMNSSALEQSQYFSFGIILSQKSWLDSQLVQTIITPWKLIGLPRFTFAESLAWCVGICIFLMCGSRLQMKLQ